MKQSQSIDEVNVQGHAFYHYTLSDGRILDAETLSADVVATAVAITQRGFHKIVKIWRKAHVKLKSRPAFRPDEQFGVLQAVNALFVYNSKGFRQCA